ncbi:MAG: response regulator [Candidatus Pacebacteria bacterium]|nr:response regulator [Candidatus Paceibacterota bacterium]
MTSNEWGRPLKILMVEDNPADVKLAEEALKEGKVYTELHWVQDGEEAIAFLERKGDYADAPVPDVILLDLNLPRKDGRQVLAEVKTDERFRAIPVVVLTTSREEEDVLRSYNLHANCYVTKPFDLDRFIQVIQSINEFWLDIVKLPRHNH